VPSRMLRRFDSSAPAIGKVYSSWFELGEHLGSAASPYQAKCLEKHELLQPWPEDEPLQLQLDQDGEPLMLLM